MTPSSFKEMGWMTRPLDLGEYLSGKVLGVYSIPEIRHCRRGCIFKPVTEHLMNTFVPSTTVVFLGPVMFTAPTMIEKLMKCVRGMCILLARPQSCLNKDGKTFLYVGEFGVPKQVRMLNLNNQPASKNV